MFTRVIFSRNMIFGATILAALGISATQRLTYADIFDGNVLDFQEREIYHSPETPGYTSWVGLWQLPNGTIQSNFSQIAGGVSSAPVIQSTDGAQTWSLVPDYVPRGTCRGMAVLDDGAMVRPRWNSDVNGIGYIDRSTDGGRTWSDPIYFMPAEQYRAWPSLIRPLSDGRLVLMAGVWERDPGAEWPNPKIEKKMFLSSDQGQTWGEPITLMTIEEGACEESDFVELPNGDLMWIHRAEHFSPDGAYPTSYLGSTRMQSISQKTGDTFVSLPPETLPWPHSGYPCELMTQEGIILDLCTTGSHWSADNGKTWNSLMANGSLVTTHYYPKAIQTEDGTIVVVAHRGGDDIPGTVDQAIILQTFRLQPPPPPDPPQVILGLVDNGCPDTGLHSYTLTATGPGVTTLSKFTIDGEVHQVFDAGSPSEWLGDGSASESETTDSYVIFGNLRIPDLGGESWDYEKYPDGPPLKVTLETITGGGDSGMGTLNNYYDSVVPFGDAYMKLGAPSSEDETVELMQVVVADGKGFSINLTVLTATDYIPATGEFTSTTHDLTWSSPTLIAGDANGDGKVDSADAEILAQHWLEESGATWADGDFNRDGAVNDIDVAMLAANWTGGASDFVPEPSTLAGLLGLCLVGLLALARCKRMKMERKLSERIGIRG